MQPKFQRKKDSSEVFFCQIKRETSSPPEWLPSFFTFPLSRGYAFPPFRRPAAAGERGPPGTGDVCHDMACALPPPGGGGKREIRHRMVSYPPLNSPSSSLGRDSLRSRVETGEMGLGSGRFSAYMWLNCHEFSLCYPPRITVRGQTVQGVCFLLRKALLRSSGVPWSTKRPCGPLAFRRATEGSRVLRKMRGS